jgi:ACS family glucarate transporter-like MFS transporter
MTGARDRPPPAIKVRWRIFVFMFLFSTFVYVQRTTLSVTAAHIMPLFHLSQMQLGWMLWAYSLSYTVLQIPAGVLGEREGARATFAAVGLLGALATAATPLAPLLLSGTALFVVWMLAQLLLGAAHAPHTPVGVGVLQAWFPVQRWGFVVGLSSSGPNLGIAITPPLIVMLTALIGWQPTLLCVAVPSALLAALWIWYGRNRPSEHPAVSAAELAELGSVPLESKPPLTMQRFLHMVRDRNVLLLSASYFCLNYAFWLLTDWLFLYLIQERHLSALSGGALAALPPVGAALGAWLGGGCADRLAGRYGPRWGYRIVPLLALPAVGVLLLLAMRVPNAYLAVLTLTFASACVEFNEGSYWAATMLIARADTMAASGVLNMLGNLGGVVGIPAVAWLTGHGNWHGAFALGTGFAFLGAALWLLIDADQVLVDPAGASAHSITLPGSNHEILA